MGKGNDRFDPIFLKLADHGTIKRKPFLIGSFFIPVGKNPGPGNRKPERFKSHLPKKSNILSVSMIKIYPSPFRIFQILRIRGSLQDLIVSPVKNPALFPVSPGKNISCCLLYTSRCV